MRRNRGRRLVLILASALPLLAEDSAVDQSVAAPIHHPHDAAGRSTAVDTVEAVDDETDSAEAASIEKPIHLMEENKIVNSRIKPLENMPYDDFTSDEEDIPGELSTDAVEEDASLTDDSQIIDATASLIDHNESKVEGESIVESPEIPVPEEVGGNATDASVRNNTTAATNTTESETIIQETTDESVATKKKDTEKAGFDKYAVDYASKSAGALILDKSRDFQGTSNLLNGDKDKYAIVECDKKDKFVAIALSEDILVKQFRLSNYERFSSRVKDFQLFGSQTTDNWIDVGNFTAQAGNGEQIFDLNKPVWARYLKFSFLTHFGAEHYLTISQIKVHGSTMVQGFHEQWQEDEQKPAKNENEPDSEIEESVSQGKVEEVESHNGDHEVEPELGVDKTDESKELQELNQTAVPSEEPLYGPVFLPEGMPTESLEQMFRGHADDDIFDTIYSLIPETLSAINKSSRESPGRRNESEGQTLQALGTSAIDTILSSSRLATDVVSVARSVITADGPSEISLPKIKGTTGISPEMSSSVANDKEIVVEPTDNKKPAAHSAVVEPKIEVPTTTEDGSRPQHKTGTTAKTEDTDVRVASKSSSTVQPLSVENPASSEKVSLLDLEAVRRLSHDADWMDCLGSLDFSAFKKRNVVGRKASDTSNASPSSTIEPIFKKLADEIRLLQASLVAHDQFTEHAIACYQKVLVRLNKELLDIQDSNENRLQALEQHIMNANSWFSVFSRLCSDLFALAYLIVLSMFRLITGSAEKCWSLSSVCWRYFGSTTLGTTIVEFFGTLEREVGTINLGQMGDGSGMLSIFPLLLILTTLRVLMTFRFRFSKESRSHPKTIVDSQKKDPPASASKATVSVPPSSMTEQTASTVKETVGENKVHIIEDL